MMVAGFDSSDLGPVQTWKKVMTDPRTFFEHMPLAGGFLNPFVFALLVLAVAGAGGAIVQGGGLKACLTTIGVGVLKLCLGAALLVFIARQLFEGVGDFEATFRGCAYAAAPLALLWIPVLGAIAAVYSVYLLILGLQRAQGMDSVKTTLTLILAALLGVVLFLNLGWPWGRPNLIRL